MKNNRFWLPEKNTGKVAVMAGKHPLLALQKLMEIWVPWVSLKTPSGVTQTLVGHFEHSDTRLRFRRRMSVKCSQV